MSLDPRPVRSHRGARRLVQVAGQQQVAGLDEARLCVILTAFGHEYGYGYGYGYGENDEPAQEDASIPVPVALRDLTELENRFEGTLKMETSLDDYEGFNEDQRAA